MTSSASPPFRVGIWCDYATHTYSPSPSLNRLITGLLEQGVEVVLLVCPGDQRQAKRFGAFGHPRFRVVPERSSLLRRIFARLPLAARLLRSCKRWADLALNTPYSVLRIPLRIVRKLHALAVCREHAPPYPPAVEARCHAWLIPDAALLWRVPFPAVALVRSSDREPGRAAEAMLCVWTEGDDAAALRALPWLDPVRLRVLPSPDDAPAWLAVLREAEPLWHWEAALEKRAEGGWPRIESVPAEPRRPLETLLFLPTRCLTGVWETTKEIVYDLAAVNRERGRLNLTLGLHETQEDTPGVRGRLEDLLPVQRLRLSPIARSEAAALLGTTPAWLKERREQRFLFLQGAVESALRADAWLALVDRFPLPLLPARPYGVMVYDTIWRHQRESYPATFSYDLERGLKPTLQAAELVIATSPQTREDVIAGYEVERGRVRLVPVACAPQRRFGMLSPLPVSLPAGPFILNPTNCTPHKGAEVLLRGQALLRQQLGARTPFLVLCGYGMRYFRAGAPLVPSSPPHQERVQRLVAQLGLREGKDVIFLEYVSDAELAWLYQWCAVVVNAARYDNGSFNLTEASYFGRPAVSSRYPAAAYLCERFGVPAHFFAPDNPEGLAAALGAALDEPRLSEEIVAQRRARFLEPEYSSRRFAERLYDLLVELAARGREAPERSQRAA